jgi:hypothetical protein
LRSSIFVALVALVVLPARAHAFADAAQFFKSVPNAATFGATSEGLYFTGAPRFASLDCSTCHGGGPQKVGLRLNADDATLFTTGYQPGKMYELQVLLTNESEGLQYKTSACTDPPAPGDTFTYVQCNNNGFGLEIDASDGPLANGYCPQPFKNGVCPPPDFTVDQTLIAAPDGSAVFESKVYSSDPNLPKTVTRNGAADWKFYWIAPKAGTGALTVYVAAVDGNGGAGNAMNDQDPYNDDTVGANFFLQEAGTTVHNAASASCSISPARALVPSSRGVWLLFALLFVSARAWARRPRRSPRRAAPTPRRQR